MLTAGNLFARAGRLCPAVVTLAFSLGFLAAAAAPASNAKAATSGTAQFRKEIQPLLKEFCYDCHADGANKGGITLDEFKSDTAVLENHDLWWKAMKNLRAGIMPPDKKPQPTPEQKKLIEAWINNAVFATNPKNPDPGKVTVRRLNRTEYRNTIRDLMGVDFNTDAEFPPDDSGHGFDNIGDILTLPPMLLEKYLTAAKTIVSKAVPAQPRVPAEQTVAGIQFKRGDAEPNGTNTNRGPMAVAGMANTISLSYYSAAAVSNSFTAPHAGKYQLVLDLTANERFVDNQFDYNKCRLTFKVDGKELLNQEFTREGGRALRYEFDQEWTEGAHELTFAIEPLTPEQRQVRSLTMRINGVTVRGPLDPKHFVRPKNFEKFFTRDAPKAAAARRQYGRSILEPFVFRAYRRPVDAKTVDRLVALAESMYQQPGKTFEEGIGQALVGVLASPRFLFREESAEPAPKGSPYAPVDEYALASRLSYFFWSSMPDAELLKLAGEKKLRKNLTAQTARLLNDPRSEALVRNFVGQWLSTRDIETVQIDARQVLARETAVDPDQERRRQRFRALREKPEESLTPEEKKEMADLRSSLFRGFGGFGRQLRADMTGDIRRAMRMETEKSFEHVVRGNRSFLELLDSDYTFLNERLARHYGLTNLNVVGDEMRLVKLPPDSPRGGVLTHGSVLAVTSNPTRTSPVKRGLFILDNILGTPPPPPPPDITPLEDAAKNVKDRTPTLRETLAMHREKPLCASCHNRMDPLGLAFENFNAMGLWRDQERGQPIDATGKLLGGGSFTNVKELKTILVSKHATEFYRTLVEKMLTYALGRGLEYYDVETVDRIVERLQRSQGRPAELLAGVIESAPFQKTRISVAEAPSKPIKPVAQRVDARISPTP